MTDVGDIADIAEHQIWGRPLDTAASATTSQQLSADSMVGSATLARRFPHRAQEAGQPRGAQDVVRVPKLSSNDVQQSWRHAPSNAGWATPTTYSDQSSRPSWCSASMSAMCLRCSCILHESTRSTIICASAAVRGRGSSDRSR